jgi:hypothetical protein
MRCYFLKDDHIAAGEYLEKSEDLGLVAQARSLFEARGAPRGAEAFEVWDGPRFVYRYPEIPSP